MLKNKKIDKIDFAKSLMDRFTKRTGILRENTESVQRYLWTDAFATLNLLALNDDVHYKRQILKIINQVHHHLGRFAPNDHRKGWISYLPEEKAKNHPTINGLRIGKKRPERKANEPFNEKLEWERDGQYFHYHTRWIMALLKSGEQLDNKKYIEWAYELSLAGSKFIVDNERGLSMHWKMSVDLSRPLITRMGAHDPLEGLLCALQIKATANPDEKDYNRYINKLEKICESSSWETTDALGIGGLLLNVIRAVELEKKISLPKSIGSKKLMKNAEQGLEAFYTSFELETPANYRLPFRECGLSLGLKCLKGNLEFIKEHGLEPKIDDKIWSLADDIENFWLNENNIKSSTYQNHLDINEVSLASSLLAGKTPEIFTRLN